MRRVAIWELFNLNACWLGLSFLWNSLHVILLPAVLLTFVADERKNTVLGLLTFVGLIIAAIIQPISGALSDRWASRWGRRRPLIAIGVALDLVFLSVMAFADSLTTLALGYIGLQISSNTAHGSMQGLLPDRIPPDQLGRGSALKNAVDITGMIAASLGMGRLYSPQAGGFEIAIGLVMAALIVSTGITLLWTREASSATLRQPQSLRDQLREIAQIDLQRNSAFGWLILSRLIFLLGVYGIQAFAQYYVRDTLKVSNPVQLTGDLLASIVLGLLVFAMLAGPLSDRFGHKPMHVAASILAAAGCLLMLAAHTPTAVLVFGSVTGAGIGIFLTANWALANELAPSAEAGKYLGLTNLATAGAGALSRLFGPIIDSVNLLRPGAYLGYTVLFLSSALFALLSLIILIQLPVSGASRK